ncbi:phage baseplate protein [Patescibacteria group bacterium]|nr:MAG: phage baseplate protein [Patescibacteria group bacterium]
MQHVWNRLQLLNASGSLQLLGGGKVQVKVMDDEILTNIDHVMPYGFSHSPRAGAKTHLIFPSGDRSYGVAMVVGDKRYEMTLQGGEVALHNDVGDYVCIKTGGVIEAKASTKVIADTPLFECTQNCKIGGDLEVVGDTTLANVTSNGKDISDQHTHADDGAGIVN